VERVAFLTEETNERLSCLLNPESLVLRRVAGVQPRRTAAGQLTLDGLLDDPLLYTGGGRTELDLDLLFDVHLGGSTITTGDVRDLTSPLWALAENAIPVTGRGKPPLVRFIWGKSWNIPAVVVAVAERLEYFTPAGVPQRSWLRMRLVRAAEPVESQLVRPGALPTPIAELAARLPSPLPETNLPVHEVIGGELPSLEPGDSLDLIAAPTQTSITDALITGAEIIGLALSQTAAGQLLASAQLSLTAIFHKIGDQVVAWYQAAGDSPALQAVRSTLAGMRASLASVARSTRERLVSVIHSAVVEIGSAIETTRAALGAAADRVGQEIARWMAPVWEQVRPVLQSMALAAAILGQAVRARATPIIAAVAARLGSEADAIHAALAELSAATSPRAAAAAQSIRSALEAIRTRLSGLRASGQLQALAAVPEAVVGIPAAVVAIPVALAAIGVAHSSLWAAGEVKAAERVGTGLQAMSLAWKNADESVQAIADTSPLSLEARLELPAQELHAATEHLRASPDPAAVPDIRRALSTVEYNLVALRPAARTDDLAPAEAAITEVKTSLADLEATLAETTGAQPAGSSHLAAAVQAVADAIEAALAAVRAAWHKVQAARQVETAQLVQASLATLEPPAIQQPSTEQMPAEGPLDEPRASQSPETDISPQPSPDLSELPGSETPGDKLPATEQAEAKPTQAEQSETEQLPGAPRSPQPQRRARLGFGERLDQLAYRYYGKAAYWRLLAIFNDLDDPLHLPAGHLLRLPPVAPGNWRR
jgi:hypothetical protein